MLAYTGEEADEPVDEVEVGETLEMSVDIIVKLVGIGSLPLFLFDIVGRAYGKA